MHILRSTLNCRCYDSLNVCCKLERGDEPHKMIHDAFHVLTAIDIERNLLDGWIHSLHKLTAAMCIHQTSLILYLSAVIELWMSY